MGERGPTPGSAKKGAPTAIRFEAALKAALQAAADANGVSFTREIEQRLAKSLAEEGAAADGARSEIEALVWALRHAIERVEEVSGQEWQTDGFTRDAIADAVHWQVRFLGPDVEYGASSPPPSFPTFFQAWLGPDDTGLRRSTAEALIKQGFGRSCAEFNLRAMAQPLHDHPWRAQIERAYMNERTLGAMLQGLMRVEIQDEKDTENAG